MAPGSYYEDTQWATIEEPRAALLEIADLADAAFVRDGELCPSAEQVPPTPPAGAVYQSSEFDRSYSYGWFCLEFTREAPQY